MNFKKLFWINGIVLAAMGVAFGLYTPILANFFGATDLPDTGPFGYAYILSFAHLFGAILITLGLTTMSLGQLNLTQADARRFALALVIGQGIAAITALTKQMQVWGAWGGWALFLLFALAVAAYLVAFATKDQANT